jgi:hypothetical protein
MNIRQKDRIIIVEEMEDTVDEVELILNNIVITTGARWKQT